MLDSAYIAHSLMINFQFMLTTNKCDTPGDRAGYSFGSWSMDVHRCKRDGFDYYSLSLAFNAKNHLYVAIFPKETRIEPIVHYLSLSYIEKDYLVIIEFLRMLGLEADYPKGHQFTLYPDGYRGSAHLSFKLPEPFHRPGPNLTL